MKEKLQYKPNYDGDIMNSIACYFVVIVVVDVIIFEKDKQIEMDSDIKLFWLRGNYQVFKFQCFLRFY